MADVFTKAKRSAVMARIRSRGNRDTELALARLLRAHGITGWRRQVVIRNAECGERNSVRAGSRRLLRVKVDFVFRRERVAVFVDGCFWHGCPQHSPPARWLRKSSMPPRDGSSHGASAGRTGKAFWRAKLAANRARDRAVNRALRRAGWRVVRIWEHTLRWATKDAQSAARLVRRIQRALR
ncbi:MAG: very short patch repair endonuclease [Limisphaerales bacterium]